MTPCPEGVRKAALLMSCLTAAQRDRLLDRLEPGERAAVEAEMSASEAAEDPLREEVAREFLQIGGATHRHPFTFLADLPADRLHDVLAGEHPRIVALALSHLPPEQAAAVLAQLTPDGQFAVICHMAVLGQIDREVIWAVETTIRRRLDAQPRQPRVTRQVQMLHLMEPAAERQLLEALSQSDPDLHAALRRAMFGADVATCC